jgi:uncharacterized metal-binding protein YceD (DUF177 family)
MNALQPFEIPITGLQIGKHNFHYRLDSSFLEAMDAQYKNGNFEVELELDRKFSFFEIFFDIKGFINLPCDRCSENIDLPIDATNKLIYKYAEIESEEEEIVYVKPSTVNLNVAKYIYELIMLAVPLRKVKDCESEGYKDCNQKILDYLDSQVIEEVEEEQESQLAKALKNININKKK